MTTTTIRTAYTESCLVTRLRRWRSAAEPAICDRMPPPAVEQDRHVGPGRSGSSVSMLRHGRQNARRREMLRDVCRTPAFSCEARLSEANHPGTSSYRASSAATPCSTASKTTPPTSAPKDPAPRDGKPPSLPTARESCACLELRRAGAPRCQTVPTSVQGA
jgi:hypothetical protein